MSRWRSVSRLTTFTTLKRLTTLAGLALCVVPMRGVCLEAPIDHDATTGVVVFTAHALPAITGLNHADQVFYLDAAEAALTALTLPNPGSEAKARAIAASVFQTPAGKAAIAKIQRTGEGISLAWQHGVRKLPAVLVGGDHVVYGIFDVGHAVALIEADTHHGR